MTKLSWFSSTTAKWIARLSLGGLGVVMVGCDHATKHVAERSLAGQRPVNLVPGFLDLRYAQNHETAFSLSRAFDVANKSVVLAIIAFSLMAFIGALWWRERKLPWTMQVGYPLVLGGALGNALDRLFRGYVVDFVHVAHWPVFNVADVAVVLGAIALVLTRLRPASKEGPAAPT